MCLQPKVPMRPDTSLLMPVCVIIVLVFRSRFCAGVRENNVVVRFVEYGGCSQSCIRACVSVCVSVNIAGGITAVLKCQALVLLHKPIHNGIQQGVFFLFVCL